jgi:hypothetical protein
MRVLFLLTLIAIGAGCVKPSYESVPSSSWPMRASPSAQGIEPEDSLAPLVSPQSEITIQLVGYGDQIRHHFRLVNSSPQDIWYPWVDTTKSNALAYRIREYRDARWREAGPVYDVGRPEWRRLGVGAEVEFTRKRGQG